ncbi:MAG TPA: flagellar basal body P-ring protein FlgI [Tepidisphaeraceae bacterium]
MKSSYRRIAAVAVVSVVAGCAPTKPVEPPKSNYSDLGPKEVPDFLKQTVWQQVDLANASPLRVSGFGLVVNLDGTGDTRAPNPVREYMMKQMQKHGFGSSTAGLRTLGPEQVLNDPEKRTALVRVDGFIPAGAHSGQLFDVQVSALENSNTTSLHHGELYEADLAPRGADPFNPGGGVINPWARVQAGPIAINPAYALGDGAKTSNQKLSMRYGTVMNRAIVAEERPLVLKLRQPERRLARQIESRVNERFQESANERFAGSKTAIAKDEGEIWLYVPKKYGTDWERFIGVVMHTYFNPNADYATLQAKNLAVIAQRDGENAPLLDISYCWEALGEPAVPALSTLYASPLPAVSFAAARAGAFLGDLGAQEALTRMARTPDHPFQTSAIEILGALPSTAQLRTTLRMLLDSDQLLVRLEAYKAMLASRDPIIVSTRLRNRFTLDLITSDGPPTIYATRVGEPRIAIIGRQPNVVLPSLLMALDNRLTIMGNADRRGVQIYYRGDKFSPAVTQECRSELGVLVGRLGGETPDPAQRFRFHYTDIVGILQKMTDTKMIASVGPNGEALAASFQIQALPGLDDPILSAPSIPEQRPQDVPTTQKLSDATMR